MAVVSAAAASGGMTAVPRQQRQWRSSGSAVVAPRLHSHVFTISAPYVIFVRCEQLRLRWFQQPLAGKSMGATEVKLPRRPPLATRGPHGISSLGGAGGFSAGISDEEPEQRCTAYSVCMVAELLVCVLWGALLCICLQVRPEQRREQRTTRTVARWSQLTRKVRRLAFKRREWSYLGNLLREIKARGASARR